MNTMDRKIAARRHGVSEQRATARLKLVVGFVVLAVLAAAAFWLVRSPLLDVDRVTITGAEHSNPDAALDQLGVVQGAPTISVDAGALEAALVTDPWIADAGVVVTWPGTVDIEVIEHIPVAVVETLDGLASVTLEGDVVQLVGEAAGYSTIVVADAGPARPGSTMRATAVLGSLEFVAGLPTDLHAATVITIDGNGQISAVVRDYPVRLGRAIDMASKAASLVALIEYGVEPGSSIDVTAARRPAVTNPRGEVEGEG